jgi:hypothetical protein
MPKTRNSRPTSRDMTAVHALGQASSPQPRTRWAGPAHGRAGIPATVAIPPPPSYVPNVPGAVSLAQGTGSDLAVTWSSPAIDSMYGAATSFALRSSLSGVATWTTVVGVSSPCTVTGLAAGAAIDVQLQSSNATGTSAWTATSTLTTAAAGPYAPNAPAISSVGPPPDGTNSKLTVIWTAPAVDSTHGAATGYNVRCSRAGAGTWAVVSGVTSPYLVTGLTGATVIDVEVQGALVTSAITVS